MTMEQNVKGIITAVQRYCLDDGPGIRTTVFLKGCPLRCKWCHNPETWKVKPECMQRNDRCTLCGACVKICPNSARSLDNALLSLNRDLCTGCGKCGKVCFSGAVECCGKETDTETILKEVLRDKLFYKSSGGGLTVSGGECALQPEFTLSLLRGASACGINTAIETCGFGDPNFLRAAADLGTLFLFDLKCMDTVRHREFTGVSNETILENLEMLMARGARLHLRLPLIPGVNDTDSDLTALCAFLNAQKSRYEAVELMPYHDLGTGKALALGEEPFTADPALSADRCKAALPRWLEYFTKYNIPVECH